MRPPTRLFCKGARQRTADLPADPQHGHPGTAGRLQAWFDNGNGDAGDVRPASSGCARHRRRCFRRSGDQQPGAARRLGRRITILHNRRDQVLDKLSETLNLAIASARTARGGSDAILFLPATYRMVDCSGFTDYHRFPPAATSITGARGRPSGDRGVDVRPTTTPSWRCADDRPP